MKKLLLLVAVAVSLTFAACSKSAADYAKETKDLSKEYFELVKVGKTAEAAKVKQKMDKLGKEISEKMEKDPEFKKQWEAEAPGIAAEVMNQAKDAMGSAEE
ncbi:MAG: hypothetical protein K2M79_02155 [Muribaculaceae bacterium]|nr:hypothetical protein [Muribaculaceae bacterium]